MLKQFSKYYLYPCLCLWAIFCAAWALSEPDRMLAILALKGGVTVTILLLFEWLTPFGRSWGMTTGHFLKRDLPMIVVNGLTIAFINYALVFLAVSIATKSNGFIADEHLVIQVIVGLLVFEMLQYSVHRVMHLNGGPLLTFLWHSHAIHHLPQQLYVVMHAVFHPINAVFVRILVQLLPIWIFGFHADAVLIYGALIALQGTVSHLNVDMRLGFLNYILIGPELHRYHHSANSAEAVNYGSVLSIFDLLFGTFYYKKNEQPSALGLREEDGYPAQHAFWDALAFPFIRPEKTDRSKAMISPLPGDR